MMLVPALLKNSHRLAKSGANGAPGGGPFAQSNGSPRGGLMLAACVAGALLLGIGWFARQGANARVQRGRAEEFSRNRGDAGVLGRFVDRLLPNDDVLTIPEHGMEANLLSHIQSRSETREEKWFDFDRLVFDSASAIPEPESEEQLRNLASILKAYPRVKLKVGGYTDNKGNREANQRLSENRAESVRRELVGMGIAFGRLEVEGYGHLHPIADNATEAGRAKNRRISLKVLQK